MSAQVVPPKAGEQVSERAEIKVGREEVVVVEFDYPPGRSGPELHVHHEHADCFWVLEGELTFRLGPDADERPAGPGTFVLVPPEVVHTFKNDGAGRAHFLNIHAPGKGFDDHLRGEDNFDTDDPPEDGGKPVSEVLVVDPDGGEEITLGPASITIKAGSEQRPGGLAVTTSTVAPGFPGPVLHLHDEMVEGFYVLEGTLALRLAEDDEVEVEAGSYAMVPPGDVHSFANRGEETVRLLNVMTPGGFEDYFREVVHVIPDDGPPDLDAMARIAAKYDFRLAG